MKKILWYSDSPTCTTGFGNVARNILNRLAPDAYIDVVGINGDGHPYDTDKYNYNIYPAFSFHPINQDGDIYGRKKLLDLLMKNDYDYLITLQDTFVLQEIGMEIAKLRTEKAKHGKPFKWFLYYPADMPLHPDWVRKSIMCADKAVSYNQFGVDCVLDQAKNIPEINQFKDNLLIIPHGTDKQDFFPVNPMAATKFRKHYFQGKVKPDDFLIVNVNRNQTRKDLTHTLITFKYLLQQIPNAKLYTHCLINSDAMGDDLIEVARRIGLNNGQTERVWFYPHPSQASPGHGMPVSELNLLYNTADVNFSTSLGEGWGLSCSECFFTKTINVMPRHTSFPDMLGYNQERGYLVNAGTSPSLWASYGKMDNSVVRPVTDVDDAVKQLVHVYQNKTEVNKKIQVAYDWATKTLNWDVVGEQWRKLLNIKRSN